MTTRHHGRCLCGAITFEASGDPKWVVHCHCESCRRATGAVVATYAGYEAGNFSITAGAPVRFASSEGVTRSFCGTCGSSLTYEGARWPGEIHIFVATLEDAADFVPRAHVHVAEQLPWLHMDDGLRRFERTARDKP